MILARVVGTLTSEDKDPELRDYKLLVVRPLALDPSGDGGWDLREETDDLIAVDRVDAGEGELVLVVKEGNAARQITGRGRVPLQAVVIGVVDRIDRLTPEAASAG
ncbi:MAG: EutN/CcmL family microcompartment protein [Gemmatimonadetes bacterium]|nr:EutN/CcmL family microcompartment protein [Gemmatimonadota bacterium]